MPRYRVHWVGYQEIEILNDFIVTVDSEEEAIDLAWDDADEQYVNNPEVSVELITDGT